MAEVPSKRTDKEFVPADPLTSSERKSPVRSSSLKYYIHDSTDACRLQLVGELTRRDIPELAGCWGTARTTLGDRKLVLDLQGLVTVDDEGRQWLAAMGGEGAIYAPDSYLRDGLAGKRIEPEPVRLGLFGKLFSIFRGSRVVAAGSSTQAQ